MTPTAWLILGFVVFDLVFVFVVVRALAKSAFEPLAREYPAIEPGELSHDRRMQSFSVGLMNLGYSVRVRTDDTHAHLTPEAWVRWTGMHAVSLPLDAMAPAGGGRRKWILHPIEVRGERVEETIRGPKWLWELVRDRHENAHILPA